MLCLSKIMLIVDQVRHPALSYLALLPMIQQCNSSVLTESAGKYGVGMTVSIIIHFKIIPPGLKEILIGRN